MDSPITAQAILQIFILLLTAKLLGYIFKKLHVPEVVGEFLAGIIWGPSILQWVNPTLYYYIFPKSINTIDVMIMNVITMIGFLSMLSISGSRIPLNATREMRKTILENSVLTMILAYLGGTFIIKMFPSLLKVENPLTTYFLAICLAMSAVPIISRILNDWGITATHNGSLLMLGSIFIDFIGWIFLAIGTLISTSENSTLWNQIILIVTQMIIGIVVLIYGGRYLFKWLERYELDFGFWPLLLGYSVYTYFIGRINLYLGGMLFGLLTASNPKYRNKLESGLNGFVNEVFQPLFFIMVGRTCNLTIYKRLDVIVFSISFILIGMAVKIIPVILVKNQKTSWRETWMLSLCLNARGGMEIVVAMTAVSLRIFNSNVYSVVIANAVLTAVACPLIMHWYMKKPNSEEINWRTRLMENKRSEIS